MIVFGLECFPLQNDLSPDHSQLRQAYFSFKL